MQYCGVVQYSTLLQFGTERMLHTVQNPSCRNDVVWYSTAPGYRHSAKSLLLQKSLQGQFPKDAASAANDVMMTITQ